MSQKKKKIFLDKINKNYKYDINTNFNFKCLYEEPDYLICHGSYLQNIQTLEQSTIKILISLMKKTVNFLDDNNITYWLDGGTLLGAIRNEKIIPWDDDIDLAIPYNSFIKIKEIIKDYPTQNINNIKYNISDKYQIKFSERLIENGLIDKDKPFLIKVLNLDGELNTNDVFIDLIMYYIIDNKYKTNLDIWKNQYYYNIDSIYPLKKIKFENNEYYSVNNPIPYLDLGYLFWRELGIASHAHFKNLQADRNTKLLFTLKHNSPVIKLD